MVTFRSVRNILGPVLISRGIFFHVRPGGNFGGLHHPTGTVGHGDGRVNVLTVSYSRSDLRCPT